MNNITEKYDVMLCYPRSGSHWVRYIIEYLTSWSTGNRIRTNPLSKLVFIIRNYKESVVKHIMIDHAASKDSFNRIKEGLKSMYLPPLQVYDECQMDKLFIEYENLTDDDTLRIECKRICDFFDVEKSDQIINRFMDNIEQLREQSKILYRRIGPTETDGKTNIFHSRVITYEQRKELENICKEYDEKLYDKYLKKYEE